LEHCYNMKAGFDEDNMSGIGKNVLPPPKHLFVAFGSNFFYK